MSTVAPKLETSSRSTSKKLSTRESDQSRDFLAWESRSCVFCPTEIWLSELERASWPEFLSKTWTSFRKPKLWGLFLQFLSQETTLIFSVAVHSLIFTGLIPPLWLQNLETHATMKESTILHFPSTTQKYLQQLLPTKYESGIPRIVKNCWEYKFRAWIATQWLFLMMERVLFRGGLMVKLEPSFLNRGNFCLWSTMPTITDALQSQSLQMGKELFQEELREKFECGKSQNRRK